MMRAYMAWHNRTADRLGLVACSNSIVLRSKPEPCCVALYQTLSRSKAMEVLLVEM